jgi:hypothetical protein
MAQAECITLPITIIMSEIKLSAGSESLVPRAIKKVAKGN